ncbi:peptidyl-prolyl cis-trans isomerase fkbp16 [Nannochloropsis oceanica]
MCVTTSLLVLVVACYCLAVPTLAFFPSTGSPSTVTTQMMATGRAGQEDSRRSALSKTLAGGLGALSLATVTLGVSPIPAAAKGVKRLKNAPTVKLANGVEYQDMTLGSGATPHEGDRVAVHYSLYYNGLEVESSRDSSGLAARPYGFNWGTDKGTGSICKGVQLGMEGMQIGGRRKITVPSDLAFGKKGLPPFIPGDATVLFDVSIWSIKPAGTNPNLTLPGQQNYF